MLLHLKNILSPEEVRTAQSLLGEGAPCIDGRSSAGSQALTQKHNQQLAQDSDAARQLQTTVLAAMRRDPLNTALTPASVTWLFKATMLTSNAQRETKDPSAKQSTSRRVTHLGG